MPELWTVLLVTIPVSLFMYTVRGWDLDAWYFWNLVCIVGIILVYIVERIVKMSKNGKK